MNKSSVQILQHMRNASAPITPGWLQEQMGIPRPTITRSLKLLMTEGLIHRLGHGTYHIASEATTTPSLPKASASSQSALTNKAILVAAQWSGLLMGHFGRSVKHAIDHVGGTMQLASLDQTGLDPSQYLDLEAFHACDAMIIYHYQSISAAFTEALRQSSKPIVVAQCSRNLPVDSVAWNTALLFERFAETLLHSGCQVLVLVVPNDPRATDCPPALKDQTQAVASLAAERNIEYHLIAFDETKLWLNDISCKLMKLLNGAHAERRIGVICWRPQLLYMLTSILSATDARLNACIHLCGLVDNQDEPPQPEYLTTLHAYAFPPEAVVGQVAIERLNQRCANESTPPTLSMIECPMLSNYSRTTDGEHNGCM